MKTSMRIRAAVLAVAAVLTSASGSVQSGAGEAWEFSGTITMEGMNMAMPPYKGCMRPDEAAAPPVDKNCKMSNMKTTGNTTSFNVQCGPSDPMTGTAKITRTGDKIDGSYMMKSADGDMKMVFSGRKTGACTPSG